MSYQIIQSSTVEIPANTSAWGYLNVSGGSLLSVGLANSGFRTQAYATQLYSTGTSNAFYQVDNRNDSSVTIQFNGVVDGNGTASFGPIENQDSKPL